MGLRSDGNTEETGLPELFLGSRSLLNFDRAVGLEWIVTNGLGGYSSSTVLNINTRKYHGLLVAALNPPVTRHLLLAKIHEEVEVGDNKYPLHSTEFKDGIHPDGYKKLVSFGLHPVPTFYYSVSGLYLKKRVFMPYMKNAVIVQYEILNTLNEPAVLSLRPLVNSRHFQDVTDGHRGHIEFVQKPIPNGTILEAQPSPTHLALSCNDGHYSTEKGVWVEEVYFRVDDSRGESCLDDNYLPGVFTIDIDPI